LCVDEHNVGKQHRES